MGAAVPILPAGPMLLVLLVMPAVLMLLVMLAVLMLRAKARQRRERLKPAR